MNGRRRCRKKPSPAGEVAVSGKAILLEILHEGPH